MITLFDSTRSVKSGRSFALGLVSESRKPFTAEDSEWAARELNRNAIDYEVVIPGPEPDWDAMAAESFAQDCLDRGLDPHDPATIDILTASEQSAAYDRIP